MFVKCKRVISAILVCTLSVSMLSVTGCSLKKAEEIGSKALDGIIDDNPEYVVKMALDKYFELYSEFDAQGVNDFNPATDAGDIRKERIDTVMENSTIESDKIDGMAFICETYLYSPYTMIRDNVDSLKTQMDLFEKFVNKFYGDGLKLEFEYEVEKIYKPEDVKTISYRSGLKEVSVDADDRIKEIFNGKEIEKWYGVDASVSWKMNGAKFGYSKEMDSYLEDIDSLYYFSVDKIAEDIDECEDRTYQFIVYKYNGGWYVYAPMFVRLCFSKHMIFNEK